MNFKRAEELKRNSEPAPFQVEVIGDRNSVLVDRRAVIEKNVVLHAGCSVRGHTVICSGAVVDLGTVIEDSRIGGFAEIGVHNTIRKAEIGARVKIPYDAQLADIKVGDDTNIARGVTVSNFDGLRKRQTKIGNGCFIGTDVNLNGGLILGDEVRVYPKLFVASRQPIPDHAWIKACNCRNREKAPYHVEGKPYHIVPNSSFKIPSHWLWTVTRKPVDPERMRKRLRNFVKSNQGVSSENLANHIEGHWANFESDLYV